MTVPIARLDQTIAKMAQKDETVRRLMSIPGFGPITASAMAATIQDPSNFAGPREFAAFLGLTPKQNSSGGKQKLGRISKMGNRNLRKLLVVGAHAVLFHRKPHTERRMEMKPYRMYIASIGGIKIDVSDQAATWARVTSWLSADEGGLRWARNLATFVGYILGSIVLAWIVRMTLRRVMRATQATSRLLRDFVIVSSGRVIVALGVLLALSALEVNLAPLLAVIGAAGFVVAFALQGTLSNLARGLLIMVFKPFDDGDQVEVAGGIKGRVNHVTIFSTYIRTEDGLQMIVPNDNIWKNVIVSQTTGVVKGPGGAETKAPETAAPSSPS